ncbi:hypothetical protein [Comamonas composti]|uniref:hypothetical protein n=1 Tax=Comamonas composti TaxID=408558 RepID=UPI00041A366A|nr:hypothetical protein [Comamonas composti]
MKTVHAFAPALWRHVLLGVCVALTLTACGGDKPEPEEPTVPTGPTDPNEKTPQLRCAP